MNSLIFQRSGTGTDFFFIFEEQVKHYNISTMKTIIGETQKTKDLLCVDIS
jgi:hypothetical protein